MDEERSDSPSRPAPWMWWAPGFPGPYERWMRAAVGQAAAFQTYWAGVWRYLGDFMDPYWIAQDAFVATEMRKLGEVPPWESIRDHVELLRFNLQVGGKGFDATLRGMREYQARKLPAAVAAWMATFGLGDGPDLAAFGVAEAERLARVVFEYPEMIRAIEPEYGFHFERGGFELTAETDRLLLYRVLPREPGVETRMGSKPVVIAHPYVLGANILCFLPGERKSYVHAWADQGVPTYVRIMKDITTTPAVQRMTGEDDARDTRLFCERVRAIHGRPVTLNGFCQGGFVVAAELLSGELDGLVDALITCVSPMDGTRSKALVEYLQHLPPRFRDLGYAVKTLPNGNRVVDGKVMSWVYKLKSMEREAPLVCLHRDIGMFDPGDGAPVKLSKTAAALNHWLIYDRNDLPQSITQMSFASYTTPISRDGTLPVRLFDRELNFKRLAAKGVRMLICYAAKDDLVDKETALAPLDFIAAETTEFPKGHGAIATSWSDPRTECALHKRFGDGLRGPVRWHLDLDEEQRPTR